MSIKRRIRNGRLSIEKEKKEPWYKRVWVVAALTSASVSAVLIQGPTLLQNMRVIPSEIQKTSDQFQSWVKEDEQWTEHWSAFPEGMVDIADMNLSEVDLQITIWAKNGQIDGTIATHGICQSIPVFNYILLRGSISGNEANVIAWDVVGGHKKEFANLTLTRDNYIMTVKTNSGITSWFPKVARIARRPIDSDDPQPDHEFCSEERQTLYEMLRKK